jgi:hypothetical protein
VLEPVDEDLAPAEAGEAVVVRTARGDAVAGERGDFGPELVDLGLQLGVLAPKFVALAPNFGFHAQRSPGRPAEVIDSRPPACKEFGPPVRKTRRAPATATPNDEALMQLCAAPHTQMMGAWARAGSAFGLVRRRTLALVGIAYRLDKVQGLTTIVWDGTITPGEWRAHLEAIFDDPDWPPGPRNLTDLRSADVSGITPEDEADVLTMYLPHLDKVRGMKSAAIAGDNFDRSRDFENQQEPSGLSLIVFNDLLNACTWLGVDKTIAQSTVAELRSELRAPARS